MKIRKTFSEQFSCWFNLRPKNKTHLKSAFGITLIMFSLIFLPENLCAQDVPPGDESADSAKNFSFVPVPYVNYNRSTGFAAGLMPMAMYNLNKNDTVSPQSLSSVIGFYTTNKSWFIMAFSRFYFAEDKWRLNVAAGSGNINYQFYLSGPIDQYFPYNTGIRFAYLGFERKTIGNLYAGMNFIVSSAETTLTEADSIKQINDNFGVGFSLTVDERSHQYYPSSGYVSKLNLRHYIEQGGKENSSRLEFDYNHYFPSRNKKDVFAARLYTGMGLGKLDFTQQFVVGKTDIRGYSQGKYRADNVIALQGEYRWNFHKKIGVVGFAGIATVFEAINEEQNWKPLPGIGAGFRYNVFPKNHMNMGLDFAAGIDDWGVYFKVGEAF